MNAPKTSIFPASTSASVVVRSIAFFDMKKTMVLR
jgi:hypothetical protein